MNWVGFEPCVGGRHFIMNCHDELEVNLIQQWSGTYLIEGEAVELGPGDVIWLHPDQPHILINQSEDILAWLIAIKPALAKQLARDLPNGSALAKGAVPTDQLVRRINPNDFDLCCRLLEDVTRFSEQAWVNNALAGLVGRLWMAFLEGEEPRLRKLEPLVRQAKSVIEANPTDVNRDSLAQELGCSPAMLSRRFT